MSVFGGRPRPRYSVAVKAGPMTPGGEGSRGPGHDPTDQFYTHATLALRFEKLYGNSLLNLDQDKTSQQQKSQEGQPNSPRSVSQKGSAIPQHVSARNHQDDDEPDLTRVAIRPSARDREKTAITAFYYNTWSEFRHKTSQSLVGIVSQGSNTSGIDATSFFDVHAQSIRLRRPQVVELAWDFFNRTGRRGTLNDANLNDESKTRHTYLHHRSSGHSGPVVSSHTRLVQDNVRPETLAQVNLGGASSSPSAKDVIPIHALELFISEFMLSTPEVRNLLHFVDAVERGDVKAAKRHADTSVLKAARNLAAPLLPLLSAGVYPSYEHPSGWKSDSGQQSSEDHEPRTILELIFGEDVCPPGERQPRIPGLTRAEIEAGIRSIAALAAPRLCDSTSELLPPSVSSSTALSPQSQGSQAGLTYRQWCTLFFRIISHSASNESQVSAALAEPTLPGLTPVQAGRRLGETSPKIEHKQDGNTEVADSKSNSDDQSGLNNFELEPSTAKLLASSHVFPLPFEFPSDVCLVPCGTFAAEAVIEPAISRYKVATLFMLGKTRRRVTFREALSLAPERRHAVKDEMIALARILRYVPFIRELCLTDSEILHLCWYIQGREFSAKSKIVDGAATSSPGLYFVLSGQVSLYAPFSHREHGFLPLPQSNDWIEEDGGSLAPLPAGKAAEPPDTLTRQDSTLTLSSSRRKADNNDLTLAEEQGRLVAVLSEGCSFGGHTLLWPGTPHRLTAVARSDCFVLTLDWKGFCATVKPIIDERTERRLQFLLRVPAFAKFTTLTPTAASVVAAASADSSSSAHAVGGGNKQDVWSIDSTVVGLAKKYGCWPSLVRIAALSVSRTVAPGQTLIVEGDHVRAVRLTDKIDWGYQERSALVETCGIIPNSPSLVANPLPAFSSNPYWLQRSTETTAAQEKRFDLDQTPDVVPEFVTVHESAQKRLRARIAVRQKEIWNKYTEDRSREQASGFSRARSVMTSDGGTGPEPGGAAYAAAQSAAAAAEEELLALVVPPTAKETEAPYFDSTKCRPFTTFRPKPPAERRALELENSLPTHFPDLSGGDTAASDNVSQQLNRLFPPLHDGVFIISNGRYSVVKSITKPGARSPSIVKLTELGAYEMFGEAALLNASGRRTASVFAESTGELLLMSRGDWYHYVSHAFKLELSKLAATVYPALPITELAFEEALDWDRFKTDFSASAVTSRPSLLQERIRESQVNYMAKNVGIQHQATKLVSGVEGAPNSSRKILTTNTTKPPIAALVHDYDLELLDIPLHYPSSTTASARSKPLAYRARNRHRRGSTRDDEVSSLIRDAAAAIALSHHGHTKSARRPLRQ